MATTSGNILVQDEGSATVATRVGQVDGVTVEAQVITITDGQTLDQTIAINSSGELKFQSSNSLSTSQAGVTSAPFELAATNSTRKSLMVQNGSDSEYLWVGDNSVTTSNGFRIFPRATLTLDRYKGSLYGIFVTGATCYVLEEEE